MNPERRRNCAPWTPGSQDMAQVDEYSREEAAFKRVSAGLSEEEVCMRALRATECEKVLAELWRTAAVVARSEIAHQPGDTIVDEGLDDWAASTIATLNLMGMETILPGEGPRGASDVTAERARVHLRQPMGDGWSPGVVDQLDALGGLIRDFHNSTVFVNGLRLVSSELEGGRVQWSLAAAHPGIIAGFGKFLMRKYINEGWRLS
jgi:hypothetical protein